MINKIDALADREAAHLRDDAHTVHVSALKGQGLETLLERIDHMLEEDPIRRVHLRIPQSEGKALSLLEARARIDSRKYRNGMVDLQAQAPESVVRRLKQFVRE